MTDSPFLIIGCGAMASMVAARLTSVGKDVFLFDEWSDGLREIECHGITLQSAAHIIHQNVKILHPEQEIPTFNYVLVLVKSWQTIWAADFIRQYLDPNGMVLTIQNGLGNDVILKDKLGAARVAVGVTTLGATLLNPGNVCGFEEGLTSIEDKPGMIKFSEVFEEAGYACRIDPDISRHVWGKLLVNAAVNPLTVLLDGTNGCLLDNPQAGVIMVQVVEEIQALLKKLYIQLPFQDPMDHLRKVVTNTSANYSSMVQDIRRGAPTEIDQINGAVVKLGLKYGIHTPVNQILTGLVKAKIYSNTRGN